MCHPGEPGRPYAASMRLADLVSLLDSHYPPAWAESWDRVGLVCGDPDQDVATVLCAVDPVESVVEEALDLGADLLVVHHPLLLTPVSSMAASTPKGRVLHRLVRGGVALFTAHTNADVPAHGVNEAIADALGLQDPTVLLPTDGGGLDKLVTYVPADAADAVRRAVTEAGAGAIGAYDSCTFSTPGEGRFRPLDGARPALGRIGQVEVVDEVRIEAVLPRPLRRDVVRALRAAHPYEEPAYDLVELADLPFPPATGGPPAATRGHGRLGTLATELSLRELAGHVAATLPVTAHGVRVAGDPDRRVRTVAVAAGSGESLLELARRAGADAVVTSDLKHHRASEFLEEPGPALVDVAHWAAEWCWLPVLQRVLTAGAQARGATVDVRVSTQVTDPWTFRS